MFTLLPLALSGCESEEEIAADMERALFDSNEALVPALFLAEVFHQVEVTPDRTVRHGTEVCGCPCSEKLGTSLPYVLTLDYNQAGCVPDSGYVPTALTGHAVLDFDGSECNATWDGLLFALEHAVSGEISAGVATSTPGLLDPAGSLTIGPWTGDVALHMAVDDGQVTIDGDVTRDDPEDPRTLRLDGVHLPLEAIAGRCPTPDAGTATLVHPEHEERSAIVDFASPGGGQVTVTREDRVSEPTDWCAFASELW